MKRIDVIHTVILIIILIIYIILCCTTKYPKDQLKNDLNDNEKYLLFFTNTFGFILGIVFASYEIRVLRQHYQSSKIVNIILLIMTILFVSVAFYINIFNIDPNNSYARFCNSIYPLLGALIIISQAAINTILIESDRSTNNNDYDDNNNIRQYNDKSIEIDIN